MGEGRNSLFQTFTLVALIGIVIPATLFFWIANILFYSFTSDRNVWVPLSPFRWLWSIFIPVFIAKWGLRRGSLEKSGAFAGLLVGFILTLSNYGFCGALMAFFVSASKATKFRSEKKRKLEEDFKEGGRRNWIQVFCNGGVATEIAILFMIESGCGEFPIDFQKNYSATWLTLAILGAISCSCGDTYSSEIGSVSGKGDPWLITTWERVPRGTNGGVSIMGFLSSLVGGSVVGMGYYMAILASLGPETLENSPPQWPIIIITALSGFLGSLIDSLLGATLQYSGFDKENGHIVEQPGKDVEYICGYAMMDNHSVNLLASLLTALITPTVGMSVYRHYIL